MRGNDLWKKDQKDQKVAKRDPIYMRILCLNSHLAVTK
jgi:hypothetical protein